jgi:hypothetical protein
MSRGEVEKRIRYHWSVGRCADLWPKLLASACGTVVYGLIAES